MQLLNDSLVSLSLGRYKSNTQASYVPSLLGLERSSEDDRPRHTTHLPLISRLQGQAVNTHIIVSLVGLSISSCAILFPMNGRSPAYNVTYRSRDDNVGTMCSQYPMHPCDGGLSRTLELISRTGYIVFKWRVSFSGYLARMNDS